MTVLVSTHYMDEAERCHRINYIAYGSLIAEGTVDEVVAAPALDPRHVTGPGLDAVARRLRGDASASTRSRPSAPRCTSSARDPAALDAALAEVAGAGRHHRPGRDQPRGRLHPVHGREPGQHGMTRPLSLRRLRALLAKEFIQMRRDRITFAMMLGVPLILLVLFGFAINNDPKRLPAAARDAPATTSTAGR